MKQYLGIARDHSGSMMGIKRAAMADYNATIAGIRKASAENKVDTIVSVVEFGNPSVDRVATLVPLSRLLPLEVYMTHGGTPLYDAVGDLIEQFERLPDAGNKDTSFLICITTDGEENQSRTWDGQRLAKKIKELNSTDRWSFIFRVPMNSRESMIRQLNLHEGNVEGWEQTEKGVQEVSTKTQQSFGSYYQGLARGETATRSFFQPNMAGVKGQEVRDTLQAVTGKCRVWPVKKAASIQKFVEDNLPKNENWVKGAAYYNLTKTEEVQNYKKFLIRNKKSGAIYAGNEARDLMNLPKGGAVGTMKLRPSPECDFDIFVQSTSTNRKLVAGTDLIYCPELA